MLELVRSACGNIGTHKNVIAGEGVYGLRLALCWTACLGATAKMMEIKELNYLHAYEGGAGFLALQKIVHSTLYAAYYHKKGTEFSVNFQLISFAISFFVASQFISFITNRYHFSLATKKWAIFPIMLIAFMDGHPHLLIQSLRKGNYIESDE
ncbi:MAG: hypothetical protein HYZ47_05240 [Simkania negevensis]|nr:hypothetical protein [Simkania negevensis]